MPHVIVQLWPGRTEQQKAQLTKEITASVIHTLQSNDASVSVAIEEIRREDWLEQVYKPIIEPKLDTLYKKPGYTAQDLAK